MQNNNPPNPNINLQQPEHVSVRRSGELASFLPAKDEQHHGPESIITQHEKIYAQTLREGGKKRGQGEKVLFW